MMGDENERAARAKKGSPFLSTSQAALYLCLSPRTLEKMRLTGDGPKYRKHGRFVRYHINDLDNWSQERGRKNFNKTSGWVEAAAADRGQP